MGYTVTDIGETTGVEFSGVGGGDIVDRSIAERCLDALDRRGVVVFREAHVSDEDLVEFSRLLGRVVALPLGGESEFPEIQRVTRDASKSKLAAYREATFFWHIDGTTDEVPNKATLLTARQVSDDGGGDTEFANTYAAYSELPEQFKTQLRDLRVVHSFAASQLLAVPNPSEAERAIWDRTPAREHPLVWTRPTGRRSMLVGATAGRIVGWSDAAGRELLDRLLVWSTRPRYVLRHTWRRGDLVIWDNTGMLHRALPYSESSARLMHRTSLAGEEAVA
ncbi:TauD/TfdA dioxygenase family protein [Nocardia aurea]|uniref:TauD/TfdA dioxygenase family protein n=1 Tax=Nocardia aurea TaxID=2144174 RepID=UPI0033A9B8D8